MTVIAGFSRVGDSAIAGDTLASTSSTKFNSDSKVHLVCPGVAVGFAGTYAIQDFIERKLPEYLKGVDPKDEEAFITHLRKAWRAYRRAQRNAGLGTLEDSGMLTIPGQLLVVTPINVYTCQTDGSVITHSLYGAIGSGASVALGVMHALSEPHMTETVADIVYAACEAAIDHVPSCGGEIDVIEVKSDVA